MAMLHAVSRSPTGLQAVLDFGWPPAEPDPLLRERIEEATARTRALQKRRELRAELCWSETG